MEWIKILDKAPRDMHNVLVLSVHNAIYLAKYNEISSEFYPVAHMVSDTPIGVVTHWMHLPEKPKAIPPLKRIGRMKIKEEMNTCSYYRKSTKQWVYVCDGFTETTSYTFKYSHRLKLVAFWRMVLNIDSDLLGLAT